MKLPDLHDFQETDVFQTKTNICRVWAPKAQDPAELRRLAVCLLELYRQENNGKTHENGSFVQKI